MLDVAKKILQVRVSRSDGSFVGECDDLNVVTQGDTFEELERNLREAIGLALDGDDLPDDFDLADRPAVMATYEIELVDA